MREREGPAPANRSRFGVDIVRKDFPAQTAAEFVAKVRAEPGKYTYATGGAGTTPHLCGEMFKTRAGVDMPVVTYRGGAPALIDLMAGRVQVMFDNFSGPIGAVREGKARGLAVSGPERSPAAPDFSGWNWTATTLPRCAAAVTAPP